MKDNKEVQALQKLISQHGYCSRRQAEKLIKEGKVKINNHTAQLGDKATAEDEIKINNQLLNLKTPQKNIYIKLNKPQGYTCTNKKFKQEKNVFDLIDVSDKLFVAGRLDKDSKGLVILTNDGYFTQTITHPKFQHEKTYIVTIKTQTNSWNVSKIKESFLHGIKDQGELLQAKEVKVKNKHQFVITLTQGKNRQIKRMFKQVGLEVTTLTRISVSNIHLNDLELGEWEFFTP